MLTRLLTGQSDVVRAGGGGPSSVGRLVKITLPEFDQIPLMGRWGIRRKLRACTGFCVVIGAVGRVFVGTLRRRSGGLLEVWVRNRFSMPFRAAMRFVESGSRWDGPR